MTASTLQEIEPGSSTMVRRATEEPMSVEVRSADGDTATVTVENVEKGTVYEVDVRGNEPVSCSCPSFQYHCDELEDGSHEMCKHAIYYSLRAP